VTAPEPGVVTEQQNEACRVLSLQHAHAADYILSTLLARVERAYQAASYPSDVQVVVDWMVRWRALFAELVSYVVEQNAWSRDVTPKEKLLLLPPRPGLPGGLHNARYQMVLTVHEASLSRGMRRRGNLTRLQDRARLLVIEYDHVRDHLDAHRADADVRMQEARRVWRTRA